MNPVSMNAASVATLADLDPFERKLTDDDLAAILSDDAVFRRYVALQSLELAFCNAAHELIQRPSSIGEFYEMLYRTYDEEGVPRSLASDG